MKVEAERRKTQGVAGEWEVVEQSKPNEANDEVDTTLESSKKREAEGPPDSDDTRSFKLRKRVAPSVMDDWDTDLIPIKLKKTEEVREPTDEVKKEAEPPQPTGAIPIKWTSRGWKRPEDEPDETLGPTAPKDEEVKASPFPGPESITAAPEPEMEADAGVSPVKAEPPPETVGEAGATFRKRRFLGNRGKR
jgi:WW domain-binding protein 4